MRGLASTIKLIVLSALAFLPALGVSGAEEECAAQAKGYSCLFMGHSFFTPTAKRFASNPARAGIEGHRQLLVHKGSFGGSPGKLWESTKEEHEARKAIRAGTVDLIGLTYYPEPGRSCSANADSLPRRGR